jgi:hypothetical protein
MHVTKPRKSSRRCLQPRRSEGRARTFATGLCRCGVVLLRVRLCWGCAGVVLLRARLCWGCAGAVLCALRCAGAVRVGFVVSCAALGKLAANFPTPGESRSVSANCCGGKFTVCMCVYVCMCDSVCFITAAQCTNSQSCELRCMCPEFKNKELRR